MLTQKKMSLRTKTAAKSTNSFLSNKKTKHTQTYVLFIFLVLFYEKKTEIFHAIYVKLSNIHQMY